MKPSGVAKRFWGKVDKTDGCWLWNASRKDDGYGRFWLDGRMVYAHRTAYELLVGPIPEGLQLDHLCRTPACVNPEHLEPVTQQENILRGIGIPVINARKTHCPSGHPYDTENTILYENRRYCRPCQRAHIRAWWARRRRGLQNKLEGVPS